MSYEMTTTPLDYELPMEAGWEVAYTHRPLELHVGKVLKDFTGVQYEVVKIDSSIILRSLATGFPTSMTVSEVSARFGDQV